MKGDNPIDTWDYQLTFSIWKNKGVSIIPNVNLVTNIGFDDMATHTINREDNCANILSHGILPIIHVKEIYIYKKADKKYFRLFIRPVFLLRAIKKIFIIIKNKI